MLISDVISSEFGQIMISILLGLGLAALFSKVCKGDACIIVSHPSYNETDKNVYRIKSATGKSHKCFKYNRQAIEC